MAQKPHIIKGYTAALQQPDGDAVHLGVMIDRKSNHVKCDDFVKISPLQQIGAALQDISGIVVAVPESTHPYGVGLGLQQHNGSILRPQQLEEYFSDKHEITLFRGYTPEQKELLASPCF